MPFIRNSINFIILVDNKDENKIKQCSGCYYCDGLKACTFHTSLLKPRLITCGIFFGTIL